jgi:hypothetical protein
VFLAALCFAAWSAVMQSGLPAPTRTAMGIAVLLLGGSLVYLVGSAMAAR